MEHFNFKKYIEDFKLKYLIVSFVFFTISYLFQIPIRTFVTKFLIDPILKDVPVDGTTELLLICFLGFSLTASLFQMIKFRCVPTLNSIIVAISLIAVYFKVFKHGFAFYKFQHIGLDIAYADCVNLSVLLLLLSYRTYHLPLKLQSNMSLIEDSFEEVQTDKLSRQHWAIKVGEYLNATTSTSSFSLGIFGEWGIGKTDFLLRLQNHAQLNSQNIIVNYNPWKANTADGIVSDFFAELGQTLKPYNRGIQTELRRYAKSLIEFDNSLIKSSGFILDYLTGQLSLNIQYEQINADIKSIGKRIIVFIDDLDRLTGSEILQVLRIIRNSGNFHNTFFVVALDNRYVVDAIAKNRICFQ